MLRPVGPSGSEPPSVVGGVRDAPARPVLAVTAVRRFFHPRLTKYLLGLPDLTWQMNGNTIVVDRYGKLFEASELPRLIEHVQGFIAEIAPEFAPAASAGVNHDFDPGDGAAPPGPRFRRLKHSRPPSPRVSNSWWLRSRCSA